MTAPQTDRYGFPAVPCSRCAGEGEISAHRHVQAGRCFQCDGQRVVVVGEAAKRKEAFLAARVRETVAGELEIGQTFSPGRAGTRVEWMKLERTSERAGRLSLHTNRGEYIVEGPAFPVRLYVPTDVAPYLEGL